MSFAEVDLFGVYVAPIAAMIVGAWVLLFALRSIVPVCFAMSGTRRCFSSPSTLSC